MAKDLNKEYNRLCWEFIKRSMLYGVVVDKINNNQQIWGDEFVRMMQNAYQEGNHKQFKYGNFFWQFYDLFKNAEMTFDQYWEKKQKSEVTDGTEYLKEHMELWGPLIGLLPMVKKTNQQQKQLTSDLAFSFYEDMIKKNNSTILLAIDIRTGVPVENILDKVRKRITNARSLTQKYGKFPPGMQPETVQRYLDVYDLYSEFNKGRKRHERAAKGTWPYILKSVPHYKRYKADPKREVMRDYLKSLCIIRNIEEKGEFPGKI